MIFETKNINRQTAKNFTKGLNSLQKIHFYRAVILYNSIYMNKNTGLIHEFKNLADIGYKGKFDNFLNKDCNILLLNCSKDILLLEFAGLNILKN